MADVFDLLCVLQNWSRSVGDDELKELDIPKKKAFVRPIRGGIENTGKGTALAGVHI